MYADDVAVLAPSVPALQRLLNLIDNFCVDNGLTINTADDKSPVMLINCTGNLYIKTAKLNEVTEVKYLGIVLRSTSATRKARGVDQALDRLVKARSSFALLRSHC